MTEYSPSQEFENELTSAMAVPYASIEFIDSLSRKLKKQYVLPKRSVFKARLAWAIIALVLAITASVIAIGPQKVMAAFERFFGYIPGVGVVEQGEGLLILAEPIELYREGILVRLEQVVADPNRTIVIFSVENIPLEAINGLSESTVTGSMPLLGLTGDRLLEAVTGEGRGWGTGYVEKLEYPPLPLDVNNIILLIPVLEGVPKGAAPEDWMIPFELIPAPADYKMLPVYEIDTTETPMSEIGKIDGQRPGLPLEDPAEDQGISVVLNRVIELEDGFIFEGQNNWTRESDFNSVFVTKFVVYDANGQEIPTNTINPDSGYNDYTRYSSPWAFEIKSKDYPSPWTIAINHMNVWQDLSNVEFSIDLGEPPQLDYIYETSKKLEVGGKEIELKEFKIQAAEGQFEGRLWLALKFNSELSILGLSINDIDFSSPMGYSRNSEGVLNFGIGYYEIPTGVRNMKIEELNHSLEGDWQIEWKPPYSIDLDLIQTEEKPLVCLTDEKWEEINDLPTAQIPAELTGHLLIETHTGQLLPQLSLLSLSDRTSKTYRFGVWSSLSPDSSKIVVPIDEGLVVVDTKTGIESVLQTPTRANYPIWFPDGEKILYLDDIYNVLYQINLDGTDIEKLAYAPDIIYPSGFIPGENKLFYVALSIGGVNYRTINLYNGDNKVLISTDNTKPNSRPIVSPNSEWYLYSTRVFGMIQVNSKLTRADGSEERLLTSLNNHPVTPGAWSLDGNWVIVNVHHMEDSVSKITPVLIQPETCEVVSLGDNLGSVTGWGP